LLKKVFKNANIMIMSRQDDFDISDLADSREFETFFMFVWKLTGIVPALAKPDCTPIKTFGAETDFNPICKLIQSTPQGKAACEASDKSHCNIAAQTRHGTRYLCHAGLVDFAIPIFVNNKHIATINCGQILPESNCQEGFNKLCQKLKNIPIDINKLRKAYRKSHYMPPEKLDLILDYLSFCAEYFCDIAHRLKSIHKDREPLSIIEAKEYVQKNFRDDISFSMVAEKVHLSRSHFSRLFHETSGITFTKFLNETRLTEAKKLLAKTDWPVTQISFEVGFNSLNYFNMTFKKYEQCTPTQYRNGQKAKTRTNI